MRAVAHPFQQPEPLSFLTRNDGLPTARPFRCRKYRTKYEYDARSFRIVKKTYDNGQLDETRHFYYNRRWQCLEERVDSSTDAHRQFVWGRRYIDDLVLRDRDTSDPKNGTLDERLYAFSLAATVMTVRRKSYASK
jgi:hypothetical protein